MIDGTGSVTVTVAAAVTEPALFVAESVYVVVCDGVTVTEEPVTLPMPEMESEFAPEMDHESVALWPCVIELGEAVKEEMVGAATVPPPEVTVTVLCAVTEPALFVAESVYVVVCDGVTVIEEPVTVPMPLMLIDVALETDHESIALWPAVIELGEAVKEEMVGAATVPPPGGGVGTVGGVEGTVPPPPPPPVYGPGMSGELGDTVPSGEVMVPWGSVVCDVCDEEQLTSAALVCGPTTPQPVVEGEPEETIP